MSDTHWRNSMKPARFFFMDARAAVPFVFCMLHLRFYTLAIAACTTLIFYFLEMRGLGFVASLRAGRVWLTTKKRPNIIQSQRTRLTDYSFEKNPDEMEEPAPRVKGGKAGKGAPAPANQAARKNVSKTVRPAAAPPKKN